MAKVSLKNVSKSFGKKNILKDINLDIKDKEFCVLVGASGCGKSTLLRLIAGLEIANTGEIFIGSRCVNNVPPKDRDIAMVFQSYALYPHLNVYENMAFGLKVRKTAKCEINRRVINAAETLGLEDLLDRKPRELSGGQRQRVALGRAIVREPKVFLMDEPLSNLDAKLRVQMRSEIKKLHKQLKTTFIYVTHDQVEALTMGDRIVVLDGGKIQQIDTPMNIYNHPANTFVAAFMGSLPMNIIPAKIDDGILNFGKVFTALNADYPKGKREILLGVRAEDIIEKSCPQYYENSIKFSVKIEFEETLGAQKILYFKIGDTKCAASVASSEGTTAQAEFSINPEKLHFFDAQTKLALN